MNGSTLTSTETSASSRKRVRSSSVNGDGPKRVRTTFGQDQLSSLHECFKRTHKPNSVELRQLIHRTGLSKRVLQVSVVLVQCSVNWFAQLVCWFIVFLCILFSLSLYLSLPFLWNPLPLGLVSESTFQMDSIDVRPCNENGWTIGYHRSRTIRPIVFNQSHWCNPFGCEIGIKLLSCRRQSIVVLPIWNLSLSLFYTIRPSSIDSS